MKKMKRKLAVLSIVALCAALLTGCGGGDSKSANNQAAKGGIIEIKLSHSSPAVEDRLEAASQAFKKHVEEKSAGKIKVTTYPNSQLGGEREQVEGIQLGTIQMGAISSGPLPGNPGTPRQPLPPPEPLPAPPVPCRPLPGPVFAAHRQKAAPRPGN